MNDEIKEYLDSANFKFKDVDEDGNETELTLSEEIENLIDNNKRLADYITNLQQENKRLKDSIDWWKDRFFGQQEYDDSHRITAIEYKKRIDKAIEYLEDNTFLEYRQRVHNFERLMTIKCDLLNILQNGSEE